MRLKQRRKVDLPQPDQRSDSVLVNGHLDALQGLEGAVVEIQPAGLGLQAQPLGRARGRIAVRDRCVDAHHLIFFLTW
jgi:hypothetical protein